MPRTQKYLPVRGRPNLIMFSVHGLLHTVAQVASCMRVSGQGISRNVHPSSWMLWSRLCLLEGKGPLFLVDSCVVAVPFSDSDSLQQTLQSAKGTLKLSLFYLSILGCLSLHSTPSPFIVHLETIPWNSICPDH